mmetsp:Transcript_29513/g.66808  ORF Transcript_29513/g.66808 Transcript_29513/m.66808 type:complete len:163 (-) Transcript_29513:132-620(-)
MRKELLLSCVFASALVLLLLRQSQPQRSALFYNDRGLTYKEKEAIRKSKELARTASGPSEPSLVDTFMGAWRRGMVDMQMVYDYKIRPWEAAHGLKDKHAQQLRVVMTQCVDCVSGCPAYKLHPFRADNFDQFQKMAMKQCGNCFEGVKGPCPANKDNHGVL